MAYFFWINVDGRVCSKVFDPITEKVIVLNTEAGERPPAGADYIGTKAGIEALECWLDANICQN